MKKLIGAVLLATSIGAAVCQTASVNDPGPVKAELIAGMDARKLQTGKTVFARTTADWKGPNCTLRQGATLQGTVEQADSRQGKGESRLAVSFAQAQCNGKAMKPFPLVITVVAQYPADAGTQNQGLLKYSTLQANGLDPAYHPMSSLASLPITTNSLTAHLEIVGRTEHAFPSRAGIRLGDVIDFKGLKLQVGAGPNRSSVLSSRSRDVQLPASTQMLLDPPDSIFRRPGVIAPSGKNSQADQVHDVATATAASAEGDVPALPTKAPPPANPFNDIEVCAPPGCAVDLPVSANELQGQSVTSLPLGALGYTPRVTKSRAGFDDEEALVWLGQGRLLFAFNPHKLIRRGQALNYANTLRIIRAVLVDTASRNVVRAVDWEITDTGRYLWPLSGGRILVHVGNELRVYSASLDAERTIPLPGPLAFVRIAPNGTLVALATVKERHTPELHASLRGELGEEPEEDVEVSILDQEFNSLAKANTVSGLMPPILLDSGQVRLQQEPNQWYRLAMNTWENKKVPLARFHSTCMPQAMSAAPNLLFLFSCRLNTGEREYRVLRGDGKVLLRGVSDPLDVDDEAVGNESSKTFVVKMVRASKTIPPDTIFTSSDLDSAEVRVYRATDGKRLLAAHVRHPAASHGDYALSPDGSQLAVLAGAEIEFFSVPSE